MKKYLLIFVVIVVCIAIAAIVYINKSTNTSNTSNQDNLSFTERQNQRAVRVVIKPGVKVVTTQKGITTIETEDYGTAVGNYGESGYRFQFSNCSGTPGFLTMKQGVEFMIDNRDDKSHKIAIDSKIYRLQAYDFAIVSIQKVGDFMITCDGGGAAHVLIQN